MPGRGSIPAAALDSCQGRRLNAPDEVKALATEMVSVFEKQQVPREALASALVFQRAAELETATVELVREVAASLARVRREPRERE